MFTKIGISILQFEIDGTYQYGDDSAGMIAFVVYENKFNFKIVASGNVQLFFLAALTKI